MNHFNKLTPAEDERLTLLFEECAEVIQVIGKIMRNGYDSQHPDGRPNNRKLLEMEMGHVLSALERLVISQDLDVEDIANSEINKTNTSSKYLHHQ